MIEKDGILKKYGPKKMMMMERESVMKKGCYPPWAPV
jgi:hypothetical protein